MPAIVSSDDLWRSLLLANKDSSPSTSNLSLPASASSNSIDLIAESSEVIGNSSDTAIAEDSGGVSESPIVDEKWVLE